MAFVDSIMHTNLVTVAPSATVETAVRRMADNGIGAVLVVDDGVLRGVFTERDLLVRIVAQGLLPPLTVELAQDEVGLVSLEITGDHAEIEKAVKWLEKIGVNVEPVEINVIAG